MEVVSNISNFFFPCSIEKVIKTLKGSGGSWVITGFRAIEVTKKESGHQCIQLFFSRTKTHQEDSCEATCNTKFGHGTPGSLGAGLGQVAVVGAEAGGPEGTLPSLLLILLIL